MKQDTVTNLLNLVKRNYNEIAEDFNATRQKEIWPEIQEIVKDLKAGDKVLDVGCGNGRLLEALKGKEVQYLGVDNSTELIKIARRNYPEEKFVMGDLLDLRKIPAHNFDYVFCLAVLPHIPSQKLRIKALEELRGKLAPQGLLIVSVWNLWSRAAKKDKIRRVIIKNSLLRVSGRNQLELGDLVFPWQNSRGEAVSQRYYHAFTKMELRDLAKKTGLRFKSLKKDKYNYWLVLK
jgi:2-polyprenyl-3-methyl-5-hydroxy-6-metoxy-1,4-benzoquinol methylase